MGQPSAGEGEGERERERDVFVPMWLAKTEGTLIPLVFGLELNDFNGVSVCISTFALVEKTKFRNRLPRNHC